MFSLWRNTFWSSLQLHFRKMPSTGDQRDLQLVLCLCLMVCGTISYQLATIDKRQKWRNSGLKTEAVSNHSLWANGNGILHLYASGVSDKLIMERSVTLAQRVNIPLNELQFNRKRQFQVCCLAQVNSLLMLWTSSFKEVGASYWNGITTRSEISIW